MNYIERRMEEINRQCRMLINVAKNENRDLNDEENHQLTSLDQEFARLELEGHTSQGRKTDPADVPMDGGYRVRDNARITFPSSRGTYDFKSFGEFSLAIRNAGVPGGNLDPRIVKNAPPSTRSTEGVGVDGGYLVPPDYRREILDVVLGEYSLLGLTNPIVTTSNEIHQPADETTPWQTSGGVQVYWESEAGLKTQSKVALKEKTVKLNKIIALVPVSGELLEDAPSLDAYLKRTVAQKIDFAVSLALIQGTGVGEPQGVLNCGSLITVDPESGQGADSITYPNIINMYSRMYAPLRSSAVWLCNQDIEPQLFDMWAEGTSSSVPVYLPANGAAGQPYNTLFGRPVIPHQACETLGDKGDIIFCAWSQYLAGVKSQGLRQDVSIHLWFDYDVTAFRFVMRIGGQCLFSSAINGRDAGTSTLGSFVALDTRE